MKHRTQRLRVRGGKFGARLTTQAKIGDALHKNDCASRGLAEFVQTR